MDEIKDLEEQQIKLSKNIPYDVSFSNDYLWQIHYSVISKRYFMLMPIKETDCAALFYVIKKQLENKEQKIFVPICYADYSNAYLNNSQMEELERFLCFFTKDWPIIHEVYDKDNKFEDLQEKYNVPYPKKLKENIIKKNYPILNERFSSYYNQIDKAIKRNNPDTGKFRLQKGNRM